MASYFDMSVPAVQALLPDSIRSRTDIQFLATEAEAELIQHYRREPLDTRGTVNHYFPVKETGSENLTSQDEDPRVFLRYYKADADSLTSADELAFKTAMRRAIATLIRIRASQEDVDPLLKSWSKGRRSVTYQDGANQLDGHIPRKVTKWLRPYDKRPKTFAI